MPSDKITLQNIKNISRLSVEFNFTDSGFVAITGKNGVGKTSLVKALHMISEPKIFQKSAGLNAIKPNSKITLELEGFEPFSFSYNSQRGALDTKDVLPALGDVVAELPIPYGDRFKQFTLIASHDADIRDNIAASQYQDADELVCFLSKVYSSNKFKGLKETTVKKHIFYFLLEDEDYYIREDYLSSGEFFLIQLFRLITSGAKLVFIDELDVALDAAAQVKLYGAIKPLLKKYGTRLIVISHSLAFMSTVDDGELYYLESSSGTVTLEQRSFGYIKSDLYGFEGYDKYILTEDSMLEGFIEYLIIRFQIQVYFRYKIIGVGGVNQLQMITEKNDIDKIFSESNNVLCIVDGDVHPKLSKEYKGPTQILCSPVEDIEKYIYQNRAKLLPETEPPKNQKKLGISKRAARKYWKNLTSDKGLGKDKNELYKLIVDNKYESAKKLAERIKFFLSKD